MTRKEIKRTKMAVLAAACIAVFAILACKGSKPPTNTAAPQPGPTPTSSQPPTAGQPAIAPEESRVIERVSPFNHNTKAHKQECTACHQRTDNEVVPRFPYHPSCIDCHQKDFTATESQMCIVCHQTPLETEAKLISFTSRLRQFGLKSFSHRDHLNPQKMPAGTAPLKCDNCHRFDQSGIEATFPRHAECYSCHTHQAGEKPGECGVCHASVETAMKYRPGVGSAFSLYKFKHGTHVKKVSCDRCHRLTEAPAASDAVLQTARADIMQISTARGQRHKSACWSCHVQAREPVCTKCHTGTRPF